MEGKRELTDEQINELKNIFKQWDELEPRDPKRIEEILRKIGYLWMKTPDWRFFQLLYNHGLLIMSDKPGYIRDPFYDEDDKLLKRLDTILKTSEKGDDSYE
ncbi:hypothetical protein [Oceanihabitans sediminis]|uniref:hypothetical protein n=1 Tax=Oceanihabitans sediminis TaxID=1812012 RepID=UPI00299D9807|nr:hypothetical protein [Oceanihabitans sediminis]MDX1279448.1 hypothetical protein [Oceanihabitans sediminis]